MAWWMMAPLAGYGAYQVGKKVFGGGDRQRDYGRPEITEPPDLETQLGQYDESFGDWFTNARQAYARGVNLAAGRQFRGQLRGIQQTLGNVAGVPFSGHAAGIEAQARMAHAENVAGAITDFDTKIQTMIGQGRIQATLGHFNYMRELALMERQGQLNWDIEQYRWDMYKDIATQQAWFDFFGNIFGAGISNAGELAALFALV